MLDRTIPPEAYPTDRLKIEYPEIIDYGNVRGMLIAAQDHDIVNLELIFESGKSRESMPGMSYFTIRMLQEGSEKRNSEEIATALESLGSFLEANTGLDRTSIKLFSLKKHFQASFEIVREILLMPTFPADELEILKSIRKKQIEQQLAKNNQYATLKFNELYFGAQHPIGCMPNPEVLSPISAEDVRCYYQDRLFTRPSFILSGNYDEKELKMVESLVHSLKSTGNGVSSELQKLTSWGDYRENRAESKQSSLRIGGDSVPRSHPDYHHLSISNTLLGGFFGSRLMQNIREEKGLTYGIYSTFIHTVGESYWMIGSELATEKIKEANIEIHNEINRLASTAPDEKEIALLKNYLQGKLMMSLDSVFGKVSAFRKIFLENLDFGYLDNYLDAVRNITPDAVSETTAKYLNQGKRINLIVG